MNLCAVVCCLYRRAPRFLSDAKKEKAVKVPLIRRERIAGGLWLYEIALHKLINSLALWTEVFEPVKPFINILSLMLSG